MVTDTTIIDSPETGNGASLGFYTPTEASRIAHVPRWTLNSWRRKGIILPSIEWTDEEDKVHMGHTFETLVFMRLIRMLREKHITLFNAVKAMKSLRERFGPPSTKWAEVKIFEDREDVYVHDSSNGYETTVATRGHQRVAELFFGEEFTRLKDRTDALLIPEQFMDYVEIDPTVRNGLPIVLDTSVLTSVIHGYKKKEHTYSEIHYMYPFIVKRTIIGADQYEEFLDKASNVT